MLEAEMLSRGYCPKLIKERRTDLLNLTEDDFLIMENTANELSQFVLANKSVRDSLLAAQPVFKYYHDYELPDLN